MSKKGEKMNEKLSFELTEDGCLSQEDTKKYYSRFGFACFGFGAASLVASLIFSIGAKKFFPTLLEDPFWYAIISNAISFTSIYLIALPLLLILLKPLPTVRPIKGKMKFSHIIACICIAFALTYVGTYISDIILTIVQNISGYMPQNPINEHLNSADMILSIAFTGLLAPVLEELVFRKILCNKLLSLGEAPAIIISAAFFGAIHGNLYQFAYAFLTGLLFGFIYVKTGKLIYSIITHIGINLYFGILASYINSIFPYDKINELLLNEELLYDMDKLWAELSPYAFELSLFMIYSYLTLGLVIAGVVIGVKAITKRKISCEKGILPPENKHRVSNFLLTGGVAAAIAIIAIQFVLLILP